MILDVLHLSLAVRSLDRSVAWYTDALGLELVHRQRLDGAGREIAQLRMPATAPVFSTHVLELVEDGAVPGAGAARLGLLVTDVHRRCARLAAHGSRVRALPARIAEGPHCGGWVAEVEDPDGVAIELVQPSEHWLDEVEQRMTAAVR